MDRYTQLSPKMQELWNDKMKEFKEKFATLKEGEIQKEYETMWTSNVKSVEFILANFADEYDNQLKELYSSTDSRITTLKSQLKHCKNPLQKLNMECEMNRLIRENGTFNAHCKNTIFKHACGRSKIHPTEKNHKLLEELILDNSNEGDVVFDPCSVSGSHLFVSKNNNRRYLGCELQKEWFDKSIERLSGKELEER